MKFEITSISDNRIIFEGEFESLKRVVEAAVKSGADLNGANLNGANLNGADLNGADLNGAKGINSDRCSLSGFWSNNPGKFALTNL